MTKSLSSQSLKSLRLELERSSRPTKSGSRMATVSLPTKSAVCHSCQAKGLTGELQRGDVVSLWESADGVDLRVYCTGADRPCQSKTDKKKGKRTGRKASRKNFSAKAEKAAAVAALAASLQPKAEETKPATQPKAEKPVSQKSSTSEVQQLMAAAKAAGAKTVVVAVFS